MIGIYIDRDDYEELSYIKKKTTLTNYLASAVHHFREIYGQPTFLIRSAPFFDEFSPPFWLGQPTFLIRSAHLSD